MSFIFHYSIFQHSSIENTDAATKKSASDLRKQLPESKPKSLAANSTLELVIRIGTHYCDLFALQIPNAGLGDKILITFENTAANWKSIWFFRPSNNLQIVQFRSLNLCIPLGDPMLIHRSLHHFSAESAIFHPCNDIRLPC